MSVEAILERVEAEAAAEAARLLGDARNRAASRIDEANEAARAHVAAACERAEPEFRAEAARIVNAARLQLLERRAELAAARSAAVFEAAATTLEAIAGGAEERWAASLRRLADEAIGLAGPGARVAVRQRDCALLAERAASHGARLEPIDDRNAPAGILARSADGRIEVDATLPTRLERARVSLAESIARTLEPGD